MIFIAAFFNENNIFINNEGQCPEIQKTWKQNKRRWVNNTFLSGYVN